LIEGNPFHNVSGIFWFYLPSNLPSKQNKKNALTFNSSSEAKKIVFQDMLFKRFNAVFLENFALTHTLPCCHLQEGSNGWFFEWCERLKNLIRQSMYETK